MGRLLAGHAVPFKERKKRRKDKIVRQFRVETLEGYTSFPMAKRPTQVMQLYRAGLTLAPYAAPLTPASLGLIMQKGGTGGVAGPLYVKKLEVTRTMHSRARGL